MSPESGSADYMEEAIRRYFIDNVIGQEDDSGEMLIDPYIMTSFYVVTTWIDPDGDNLSLNAASASMPVWSRIGLLQMMLDQERDCVQSGELYEDEDED